MFRYADRFGFDREGIVYLIKVVVLVAGYLGEFVGFYLFRKGGVTVFFVFIGDFERLKRYGGWIFDVVYVYLYEDYIV